MAVAATGPVTTRAFPHTAPWPARQSHPHWEPQMQVTALNGYSNHEVISGRNRTTPDSSEPLEVLEEGGGPTMTIGVRQLGPQCPPTKQKPKANLPVTSPDFCQPSCQSSTEIINPLLVPFWVPLEAILSPAWFLYMLPLLKCLLLLPPSIPANALLFFRSQVSMTLPPGSLL